MATTNSIDLVITVLVQNRFLLIKIKHIQRVKVFTLWEACIVSVVSCQPSL